VVETCVSFERFSLWKLRSPLRPGAGGSPEPSFGRKLFIDAQASISVPSTEKYQQQLLHLRQRQKRRQELACHLRLQQPIAVVGEHRRMPERGVHRQANEPPE
jgi:hypothetical protein